MPNGGWKKFRTPWGQEVLISGHLDISQGEHGDFFVYAQGDRSAPPSGHMPESGYYFDLTTRHVRDLERDTLDPAGNLEEFAEVSQEDLDHFEKEVATGVGYRARYCGQSRHHSIVDVGLIQGPSLKYPKGIRSLPEWLVATAAEQDDLHEVFARQSGIAVRNLTKIFAVVGNNIDVL